MVVVAGGVEFLSLAVRVVVFVVDFVYIGIDTFVGREFFFSYNILRNAHGCFIGVGI